MLILSTHVDDFKDAGDAEYRRNVIAGLEEEFSALKIKKQGRVECVGVMRKQNPATCEVWTHQPHYVPQINEILVDFKARVPDEQTRT